MGSYARVAMLLLLVCMGISAGVRVSLCVVSCQGCRAGACLSCSVGACPDAFSFPWCVLFALPTCVCPPDACLPCSFGVLLFLICCVSCRLLRRHYHFVASLFVALVFFIFVVCLCHLFCRPFRPFCI